MMVLGGVVFVAAWSPGRGGRGSSRVTISTL